MRFKEVKKLINEQEDLFEVKMTSKNLAKLAKDIPGVKIGLEFEMIVPNTSVEDQDMEPDYDEDQRVRDIDDAVSFFDDGDYNGRHELRQLRGQMESDFFDWQIEQLDQAWHNNGFEFFQEYLDREDPFDPEDHEEEAYDYVLSNNPTLHPDSDEFNEKKNERLQELNSEYYIEQWEDQGRNYDYAREEFDDEQRDNFTDSDWLDAEGIRYASDVESNYGYVTWPYYRSSDDDTDVKTVALDFMNAIGDKMIAVGDYHGYGGGYQKWTGSEWIKIGSAKPEDCFTVEPDGSLSGDSHKDTGLEFVSPPIPLDQIGETMKRVQQWAGNYGAYTGAGNATSMHTNISVPGYDLDKLDYLKAAILLGDEHVLREFDRINNSYTKPAIEKVKLLVQEKPDKAKELLDKMKSHLESTASKMIHSGVTDKYTSINTKDNRVEFRSPGGDYLSIIADDPQKMVDTINRMVVTLDAAMDPEKYKQEYQKKLYKVLTGQAGGRESKTGKKQEMKASDKDLLNLFARYAAGELPKQALKSFVRQAQLQRKVAKGETGKMWWNVTRAGSRMEVVAKNELDAKLAALKEWGRIASASNLEMTTAVPLRPYEEEPAAQQPEQQPAAQQSAGEGNWGFWITSLDRFARAPGQADNNVLRRFNSREEAEQFQATHPNIRSDIEIREINPAGALPDIFPELPSQQAINYELYNRETGDVIDTFPARNDDEAMIRLNDYRRFGAGQANPNGVGVRQQVSSRAQPSSEQSSYELYRISDGRTVTAPAGNPIQFLATSPEDAESKIARYAADFNLGAPELFAVRSVLQVPAQDRADDNAEQPPNWEIRNASTNGVLDQFYAPDQDTAIGTLSDILQDQGLDADDYVLQAIETTANEFTPHGPGPWTMYNVQNGNPLVDLEHTNRAAAETEARTWMSTRGLRSSDIGGVEVRTRQSQDNWSADFERRMQQPAPTTSGEFTGEWKVVDPNGNEIYRFGGVGNSQADANVVAIRWLRDHPRHMQGGVEVLPVMG